MTKPLRNEKLIFVWNNGVDIFEKLTRKEVKDFETMTPDEKIEFVEEHEKDSVFYPSEIIYYPEGDCTFVEDEKSEDDRKSEIYHEELIEYILDNWKDKGTITNEKSTKEDIELFLYLLSNYRLKCLLSTIIDVDDLWEEF